MRLLTRVFLPALIAFLLPIPLLAQSIPGASISFGGKVIFEKLCLNGIEVTIKPAGAFPINYIYSPFTTLTLRAGGVPGPANPPVFGQNLVGVAGKIPVPCYIPFGIWGYGFPMLWEAVSFPI